MPYTDAGLNAHVDGVAAAGTRIAFFTADPGTTGANEISGTGRPATTWAASSAGPSGSRQRVGSQVSAPIPAATAVTHWGIFTAATGGTLLYGDNLRDGAGNPITESFGGAGTLNHTPTIRINN